MDTRNGYIMTAEEANRMNEYLGRPVAKEMKVDQLKALEMAWGIIANAGNGDWGKEQQEWVDAACKWRDDYFALSASGEEAKTEPLVYCVGKRFPQ